VTHTGGASGREPIRATVSAINGWRVELGSSYLLHVLNVDSLCCWGYRVRARSLKAAVRDERLYGVVSSHWSKATVREALAPDFRRDTGHSARSTRSSIVWG
jgi:hypothetical protein